MTNQKIVAPNSIVQELFLSTWVDEVGAFGMKGWGKSWSVLQECLYDIDKPDFSAIIFRRTSTDFEDLWTKAQSHYLPHGGTPNGTHHIITFPSGARVRFGHMQHAKDVLKYDGQEFQRIIYDELMQFPSFMYTMGFSWLRGANPLIPKKIKSTGNFIGEGKAFVKKRFVDVLRPWKATTDGKALIQGDIGWFTNLNNADIRASKEIEDAIADLRAKHPKEWKLLKSKDPKLAPYISRMWIWGNRAHNTTLMEANPDYEASLDQLPEREKNAYKYGYIDSPDPTQQLIKTKWWEKAISGDVQKIAGNKAFGFDYAGVGKDICSLAHGEGNQLKEMQEWEQIAHPEAARMLCKHIDKHGRYRIRGAVDSVGEGSGVYTNAQELGYGDRLNPLRYKDHTFKNSDIYKTTMTFDNLRSQIWFKFSLAMEKGLVDLSYLLSQAGLYDNFAKLEEEILSMRATQKGNVYKVIPKSELKKADISEEWGGGVGLRRSPDRADSVVYWWWIHDWEEDGKYNPVNGHLDYGLHQEHSEAITCEAQGLV